MGNVKFVIVIPSYNNEEWCQKNLHSALRQNYSNYRVIYTDDCSTDNTRSNIQEYLKENDKENKVELVLNEKRLGAMNNMYNMVHNCEDDEVIVVLDGDDWLAHSNVLSVLNSRYSSGNVWMTYGQYKSYPDGRIGCSRQIPQNIIQKNLFRRYQWCSSHLRTYYTWLFKKIRPKDLQDDNGKWLEMTSDLAAMFPMLEMAGERQVFIPDILYIYNYTSPLNDAKVDINKQQNLERKIRSMRPYQRIK